MNLVVATSLTSLKKKHFKDEELENVIITTVLNGAEELQKTAISFYSEWEITNYMMNLDFTHKCMMEDYISDNIHTVTVVDIETVKDSVDKICAYCKDLINKVAKLNKDKTEDDDKFNEDLTIYVVGESSVASKLAGLMNQIFKDKGIAYIERNELDNKPIYLEAINVIESLGLSDMENLNNYLVRNFRVKDVDLLDPVDVAYTLSSCFNMPSENWD
jgi:hypothetical protein